MDLSRHTQFYRGRSILVVPDIHYHDRERPEETDRLYALARMIAELKPDIIVLLGDVGEFRNVASWIDKIDGQHAKDDASAFREALQIIMSEVRRLNRKHIKSRRRDRIYEPIQILCEGNHEERWRRRSETKMLGHDYIQKLAEAEGWRWVPFLEIAWVSGIGFSHFMKSGTGKLAAAISTMVRKGCSFFVGHEHTNDIRITARIDGTRYTNGKLGCWKSHLNTDIEAGEWAGITLLTDVTGGGACSVHQFSYDLVLERYGEHEYACRLRNERCQAAQELDDVDAAFGSFDE